MAETKLDFLTNEPIAGGLLAERLAVGPVPAGEALELALEIGGILHKAHANGQVHGNVSPFTVVLTGEGARLARPEAPTISSAPYRAPEQVRGGKVDWRSDIFSYGTLLYELVSGRRAFPGTGGELDEQIASLPPAGLTPEGPIQAAMAAVAAGCLEKDPARRRQRVQNAIIELKLASRPIPRQPAPGASPVAAPTPTSVSSWKPSPPASLFRRRFGAIGIAVLAVAATSVAVVLYLSRKPAAPVLKFTVTQPEHTTYPGMPAVSPDGRYLTFSAVGPEGKRLLWLQALDALNASVIPGTEGGSAPFWSPNSRFIGFFANKSLKKVRIAGGAPEPIGAAEAMPGGGTWNRDDVILFAPGLADGLYKVPATGGKPEPVVNVDPAKQERSYLWPQFLPDGKHFIFYAYTDNSETSGVYAGSLDSTSTQRLVVSQTNAVYSAAANGPATTGFLLYMVEGSLTAIGFNASRLETSGNPITLATDIGSLRSLSLAPISVSNNAVMVYQSVGASTRQLVWLDRGGRQMRQVGEPGGWGPPRISPDGTRVAAGRMGPDGKAAHLWVFDSNGVAAQITEGPQQEGNPIWSPDGSRVAYQSMLEGEYAIYTRPAAPDGRPDLLLRSAVAKFPADWSRDGRYIIFTAPGAGTALDLWGVSTSERRAGPIRNTVYNEGYGAVSPDGRWLAYQSDETGGRYEIHVQPFGGLSPGTRRRYSISKGGGGLPRWRADGAELYYITPDGRVMAVAMRGGEAQATLEAGNPQMLFQTRPIPGTWNLYDVSPDGQKFLLNLPLEWASTGPMMVVTNWTGKLKE